MIICTNCKSGHWNILHRSAIDPAEDTFKCKICGHKFKRYDEMKNELALVVGNVGTFRYGSNGFEAVKDYNDYVKMSKANYGRVAGESVILFKNGEIHREHEGDDHENS